MGSSLPVAGLSAGAGCREQGCYGNRGASTDSGISREPAAYCEKLNLFNTILKTLYLLCLFNQCKCCSRVLKKHHDFNKTKIKFNNIFNHVIHI